VTIVVRQELVTDLYRCVGIATGMAGLATGFGLPSQTAFWVLILPAPLSAQRLRDELNVSIPEPTSIAWGICND
jgi:hypothetical protein